jgi:hypothetical protein
MTPLNIIMKHDSAIWQLPEKQTQPTTYAQTHEPTTPGAWQGY